MNNDYNPTTLFVGIGIAIGIVLIAIIVINAPEMGKIISEEGVLY